MFDSSAVLQVFFGYSSVKYLGHIISGDGIHPDPEKVAAVQQCKPPTNHEGVGSFLGLAGYCFPFVVHIAILFHSFILCDLT